MSFEFGTRLLTKNLKGEWDHFLYVGKIAFYGWAFHFGESNS